MTEFTALLRRAEQAEEERDEIIKALSAELPDEFEGETLGPGVWAWSAVEEIRRADASRIVVLEKELAGHVQGQAADRALDDETFGAGKMALARELQESRTRVAALEDELSQWQCESHPWSDSNGDPLCDPDKVREQTDAAIDIENRAEEAFRKMEAERDGLVISLRDVCEDYRAERRDHIYGVPNSVHRGERKVSEVLAATQEGAEP